MSSCFYCGSIRMNPEVEKENSNPMRDEGYPYKIPKVYLEGIGEDYYPQTLCSWDDDSVVVIRDTCAVKYTLTSFLELLAEDETGNTVWIDGRRAPYSDCWKGKYLDDFREAHEYSITEYDLKTYKKKNYKVVSEEQLDIDDWDLYLLSEMVEKELLSGPFKIKDDVLLKYTGIDEDIIVPDGVKELDISAFEDAFTHYSINSIKIPKTVEKLTLDGFVGHYDLKHVEIATDNPRYISKDGFVIDKKTKTLIWAHTGTVIPNDGSVRKIASNAFCWRDDIEEIEIPDAILEIDDHAFSKYQNIKYVKIPDSFKDDGERIFGAPLIKEGDKYRIDMIMIDDIGESPF